MPDHPQCHIVRPPLTQTHQVIKALYDYDAPKEPPIYLSFSAGDFLHVVGRENDSDWYEACNPLAGSRGLVPVKYFEGVGKTVRDSGDSTASMRDTHDSGYAEGATPTATSTGTLRTSTTKHNQSETQDMSGHRSTKSLARAMGGVYGVVSYDFQAERPDELDAKEGEAIIVIAQSNPEWFVAKPITRLGGPGLIPVSFIEIRDMVTGKAVDDPIGAIAKAGIPRVEEWKKMAAEYKNTSIPLGSVSSSQQLQQAQQGMDRMSLGSGQQNSHGSHSRQPSISSYQQQQQQNLFAPIRASVPRFIYSDDKFHFIVECKLSNGTHWDLSRVYEDFYELQINLINVFPIEAGKENGQRTLPYMPGPVKYVTDNISEGRRANLDEYLRDLLRLPQHISSSSLVRNFFQPKGDDYEVDLNTIDAESHARPAESPERYSATSQGSYQNGAYSQQQQQHGQMRPPQQHPYSHHQQPSQSSLNHQRGMSTNNGNHYRSPSEFAQQSGQMQTRNTTNSTTTAGSGSTAPVKVKAWFDRDTCVVIRMPPRGQFGYEDLYRKIVERRKLEYKGQDQDDEDLDIEYRDEQGGEYYRLEGDEDLEIAVERNEKLTLAVRATGS
nr:protein scd2/ral3 [Quercus suber]